MSGTRREQSGFIPIGILNFRRANNKIRGRVGYKGASPQDMTLPYVRKKPGGSDVGHIVAMNNSEYIIKTGVTLSLLGQALKNFVRGDVEDERECLGFIVGNFIRIAGDSTEHHPELVNQLKEKYGDIKKIKLSDLLTKEITETLNQFKETEAGKSIQAKLKKEALNTNDIYRVYFYLVTQNEMLRDVIGLASFSDLINGVCGQIFSNSYQENSIPREILDDNQLLIVQDNEKEMYIASRFIQNAEPFDKFLLQAFQSNKLEDFPNKESWLEKCKQDLSANLSNLRGLASAILIRHIMGESADLGPDNMLIISNNNAQHIINIDITGFRYPRRNIFQDKVRNQVRLGWEDTLKCNNPDELVKFLFDSTVFSSRFILDEHSIGKDLKLDVFKVIIDVLKSKISASDIYTEVSDVREWLQTQNIELAVSSLKEAVKDAYAALNPKLKPHYHYLEKLITHNIGFIRDSIQVSQDIHQGKYAAFKY